LDDPIGTEIILEDDGEQVKGTIVGVLTDFHYQSLHEPIRPILLQFRPYFNSVFVKLDGNNFQGVLDDVEIMLEKFQPGFDFEYSFLDETLRAQYNSENKMAAIFGLFAVLAISISCLGLFGLASLNYAQRKKEVGIRKVLGAPVLSLLVNLVKGYSWLILIATFSAIPIAWFTMNDWLNHFVYKTSISVGIFLLTGLVTMLIAWLTIGYLTLRTAAANPVDALKEE
jgi:putative ABC transport system permease protein